VTDPISVMIADDEDAIRKALTSLLSTDPGIVVVGEASDAQDAIDLAARHHPAVALLDVRMPRGGGSRAASEISRRSPDTRVIALSAHEDADTILAMLDAGASAYVTKGDDTGRIIEAIHRFAEGSDEHAGSDTERASLMNALRDTRWAERRRERSRRIQEVIEAGGPRMVYQPVFDITDGRWVGAEALARFEAPPARSPDRWFAEAEQAGLRVEVELASMRTALADLARLDLSAFLSINVSPSTCCSPQLSEMLEQSQAERLVLEITEHDPVADYAQLSACLSPIRDRGVRVAVDDTGAGFSSLSHVLGFSPELIKLDIEMSRDIESDDVRRALVRALAGFASHIGAEIVAEGIESPPQLFALRDAGVRFGQGFLLGRPEPLPESGGW
jgi:EAL domain-containing protein (putative c-di-GMP-specific phosphodiesterase class I)/DNA-binding NarL/FixJ family response regulator